jgi:hypothetical protein
MPNGKRLPLHRPQDPHNVELEQARQEFLRGYGRRNPNILKHLGKFALRAFRLERAGSREDMWPKVQYSPHFPRLTTALENWARTFHLLWQEEPAPWAMENALSTLLFWSTSIKAQNYEWHFPFRLHQEYPSSDAGLSSVSTSRRPDLDAASIQMEIPSWDQRSGETARQFRRRFNETCKLVREQHIEQINKEGWTTRRKVVRTEYIEGLAMWQAGSSLDEIRLQLAELGVHVGSKSDPSGIVHGIENVAKFIGVDRRPG